MMISVVQKDLSGGGWCGMDKTKGQESNSERTERVQVRMALKGNQHHNGGIGDGLRGRFGDYLGMGR